MHGGHSGGARTEEHVHFKPDEELSINKNRLQKGSHGSVASSSAAGTSLTSTNTHPLEKQGSDHQGSKLSREYKIRKACKHKNSCHY